jgi:phosphoglycolate phosphatase
VAAANQTVGFDLDLTLVDSADGIVATFLAVAHHFGRAVDPEAVRATIGIPLEESCALLLPGVAAESVVRYRELYPSLGVAGVRLLPGARAALDAVHAQGQRVAVVTAKIESAARLLLDRVGLDVDVVVADRYAETKGAALVELGAWAHVGDHPGDIVGARTAGIVAVGVTTGTHDGAALRAAGADVVLASLEGFPAWLDSATPGGRTA